MSESTLVWKGPRLYRAWPNGTRHQYLGTLVANTGGWAAWAKGLRLGAWADEEAARRALEDFARLERAPRSQTEYLKNLR